VGGPVVSDVPASYRDLELMLQDRGVAVDHTTIFRGIQAYAAELEKRIRPYLRPCNGSWRVEEMGYPGPAEPSLRLMRSEMPGPGGRR
jgi:hypothetical protein